MKDCTRKAQYNSKNCEAKHALLFILCVLVCFPQYSVLRMGWMRLCDHDAFKSPLLPLYN